MDRLFFNPKGTKFHHENPWKKIFFTGSLLVTLLSACLSPAADGVAPTLAPSATETATLAASATPTSTASPTLTSTSTPTLTPEPAWYEQIDATYSALQYRYGLVNDPQARIYTSLKDAVNKTGNFGLLPNAPAYVAIFGEETRDGHKYYTSYYGWMDAETVQLVTPSTFRGILLTRDIPFRFGWVLKDVESANAAGLPIRTYHRYDIVHEVPAQTENPGHVAVGPDEWLPQDAVALTNPGIPDDAGQGTCRFIYVDLSTQILRVYNECKLVFATLVSTGKQAGWTFPGRFAILFKVRYLQLTPPPGSLSVYYLEGVPNFMTYYGDLGFHGAYWHDNFGSPVSHGCVNLSPADAKWLYEWAWMGERVVISAGN